MTSVWAVEQGSYSDYRVTAVCATKEIADEWARLTNLNETYDTAEVQEWPLVEALPKVDVTITTTVLLDTKTGEEKTSREASRVTEVVAAKARKRLVRGFNEQPWRFWYTEDGKYRSGVLADTAQLSITATNATDKQIQKALDDYIAETRASWAGVKV